MYGIHVRVHGHGQTKLVAKLLYIELADDIARPEMPSCRTSTRRLARRPFGILAVKEVAFGQTSGLCAMAANTLVKVSECIVGDVENVKLFGKTGNVPSEQITLHEQAVQLPERVQLRRNSQRS